ncbi:MAG: hypothetical protein JSS16_12895 [Proteobacteria bacterium]|uniref:hypothetical protein n=1 Tax=Rudaea sp. TaxID=2136325 RepID=UPI001D826F50|nr:hypothetical protein [Pseudomonadota bacterium]MBS0566856.1 hypothetical protein [Pseudomonadota bacterium]
MATASALTVLHDLIAETDARLHFGQLRAAETRFRALRRRIRAAGCHRRGKRAWAQAQTSRNGQDEM